MKVTYVILTFGRHDLLIRCLESFRRFHPDDPLIVADNGGPQVEQTQKICDMYQAKLVRQLVNGSLSKNMNAGVAEAQTDYVCIATNGVEFTTRLSEQFEKDFECDPLHVMVGGLLFYSDGKIQHGGGRRFWNYQSMGHYGQGKFPWQAKLCSIPAYRIYVTGATAAIRKSFWENNKYDENLTMGCEDTDLCFRAWQTGHKVFYDPEITSIHNEGATRGRTIEEKAVKDPWALRNEQESYKLFQSKYGDAEVLEIDKQINELNRELHPDLPVGFVRNGATGDVLRTLNTYDALDGEKCVVITQVPEAFRDRECFAITNQMDEYAVSGFIDLDMAYERQRGMSMEQAYHSLIDLPSDTKNIPVDLKATAFDWYQAKMQGSGFDWDKPYVVMHFGAGWAGKVMPVEFWKELSEKISMKGYGVVSIGRGDDYGVNGPRALDLVNKTSLHMLRAICEHAKLYIGNDSGPLHVADGACPAIGLFTVTTPEKCVSDKVTGIMTSAPCAGCQLRRPLATNYECDFKSGDIREHMCSRMFNVDMVFDKAFELLAIK